MTRKALWQSDEKRSIPRTNVLVVDGRTLDRELMCCAIHGRSKLFVQGSAANTDEALRFISESAPDIVLLKSLSPGVDSLEVINHSRENDSSPPILVFGPAEKEAYLVEIVRAGAQGYIPMTSSIDELVSAIEHVVDGVTTFEASKIPGQIRAMAQGSPSSRAPSLSKREGDVLRMIARGLTSKEVAIELCVSPRTVDCHRMNIMHKLGVHKVADLVRFAVREGLVSAWDGCSVSAG